MKKKQNFFEKKSVTATFSIIALLGGFYFLLPSLGGIGVTGNIIYDDVYQFSLTGGIGALLILCALILGIHSVKKK